MFQFQFIWRSNTIEFSYTTKTKVLAALANSW